MSPPASRLVASILVAWFLIGLSLSGCDDPPAAPEPTVDIASEQQELRQKVEQTQAEAKERVDQVADKTPDNDAGATDTTPQN
jgi:hypothetical protein